MHFGGHKVLTGSVKNVVCMGVTVPHKMAHDIRSLVV